MLGSLTDKCVTEKDFLGKSINNNFYQDAGAGTFYYHLRVMNTGTSGISVLAGLLSNTNFSSFQAIVVDNLKSISITSRRLPNTILSFSFENTNDYMTGGLASTELPVDILYPNKIIYNRSIGLSNAEFILLVNNHISCITASFDSDGLTSLVGRNL